MISRPNLQGAVQRQPSCTGRAVGFPGRLPTPSHCLVAHWHSLPALPARARIGSEIGDASQVRTPKTDGAGNSDGCLARRRDTTVPLGTTLSETTCWRGLLWQVLALSPGTALRCSRSRPSRRRDACASEDQDLHLQGHLSALHCRRPRVHRCWWPFRPQGHPSGGQSGQRRAYIYVTSSHVVVLQLKVVAVVRRTPVLEN